MENWKFALSSILGHKMRAFLTMLGIIIGVASVVLIMALGKGMKDSVTNEITKSQKNLQIYYKTKEDQKMRITLELKGLSCKVVILTVRNQLFKNHG